MHAVFSGSLAKNWSQLSSISSRYTVLMLIWSHRLSIFSLISSQGTAFKKDPYLLDMVCMVCYRQVMFGDP